MSTAASHHHGTPAPAAAPDAERPSRHWRAVACLWSLLALCLGLGLSLLVQDQQWRRAQVEQWSVRDELANKVYAGLQGQLQTVESLLRATQSLYLASEQVTPAEFADFFRNMRTREHFPALLALTFAQRTTQPDGVRYIIRQVEPHAGSRRLLGLDVASQRSDHASLLKARDSDQVTMSAPFPLLQGAGEEGVTLRLPIFSPGDAPQTVAQRRARDMGSVAASFRLHAMIEGSLPQGLTRTLRLRVRDVSGAAPQLLYDSLPGQGVPVHSRYRYERMLTHGDRRWEVVMYPLAPQLSMWHWATLLTGATASLLLALLVYSVASTRQRALELGWQMSRRYRESEERFRVLNEKLPALVLLAGAGGAEITYANQAARARFGEQSVGRRLPELFEDADFAARFIHAAADDGEASETQLRNAVGEPFWARLAISRVEMDGQMKLLLVASDISEQRRLTERLSHQASHDALTELYNRQAFEQRLLAALAQADEGTPFAVLLYLDLDQFKLINDTSGHLAGDQLLAQLGVVMRRQLREHDVLARLGGDEFGILAFGMSDRAAAEQFAERVRRSIDGYVFTWEQRSYLVSASIGGVLIDHPKAQAKDLLAQADAACYLAKEQGRNRVYFHSERDDETVRRHGEMEWANRLQWAVDEGRLLLAYQEIRQPAEADAAPCVELLLRFRDEAGALLEPGVFLPAAERYGLMPVIDRWVVQAALAHFNQLHPAGAGLAKAAINLSGASVEDESLADQIVDWLRYYQVDPARVCFEITETVAVRNLATVARFMARLRAAGCCIALDDFGAGMSSFSYLKHLPVDILKIDGSFVRDMLSDPVSRLMVRAVTDIAHQLGLIVVAEWVSDEATERALIELGVNGLQGFGLHRPELAVFLRD